MEPTCFGTRTPPVARVGTVTNTVGNADDLYLFSGTSYTTGTITATGTRAASSITFDDNVALTLAGAITIGGTGAKDGIYVASGDNAANAVTGTLTLNGNNTIQNDGTGALTIGATALEPSIDGTGNLELKNNSSGTISLASTTAGAFNFTGSITNSGTGTGGVNIGGSNTGNALIGSNVTSITQNSLTSALTVFGGNTAFTGGVKVLAGTANLHNSNVSGGASGSITLGDTSGTAAASIYIGSGTTNATPITVQPGSSGVKTIGGYYATGPDPKMDGQHHCERQRDLLEQQLRCHPNSRFQRQHHQHRCWQNYHAEKRFHDSFDTICQRWHHGGRCRKPYLRRGDPQRHK